MAEPFDDRQVDRFLQQMEARVAQMRQAADEEKVGSQVQLIVATKTVYGPTLIVGSPLRACSCLRTCTCPFCKWPSLQQPLTAPGSLLTPHSQPSI